MITEDKIRDAKLQYGINMEVGNISHYHQVKMINMNILQVKKYYLLIEDR